MRGITGRLKVGGIKGGTQSKHRAFGWCIDPSMTLQWLVKYKE